MPIHSHRFVRPLRCAAACAALAAGAAAMPAAAQLRPTDPTVVPDSSTQAFQRADHRMMEAMDAARYTGDADRVSSRIWRRITRARSTWRRSS